MKVLIVLTSHDELGDTGRKTGFWLEELAAPYLRFKQAGYDITLVSPKGGRPPLDPKSNLPEFQTDDTRRFEADPEAVEALASTGRLDAVSAADFDTVFYPGGHGPLWDLAEDQDSVRLIESTLRAGKPVALVCHAPGVLRHATNEDGTPLVQGRKVTGFTNSEEIGVKLDQVVPFLVEDELIALGADYSKDEDWASYVVEDGVLITGQNPTSSAAAADALIAKLASDPPTDVRQNRVTHGKRSTRRSEQSPVVVLVHGAFAESASWNGVIENLRARGVDAVAVANPLRSVTGDAAYLRDVVAGLGRPVLLVGHSYGGMVITEAGADNPAVVGLVYVAAFAPDTGESALQLSTSVPGSTLGEALTAYPVTTGGNELTIRLDRFHGQFAADVPLPVAEAMSRTQRPVTESALDEGLPTDGPAWKALPSWAVFGAEDRNIPTAALRAQAERAGARGVREVPDASHAISVSRPHEVTATILDALADVISAAAA